MKRYIQICGIIFTACLAAAPALYAQAGKWGYIRPNGSFAIEPAYDYATTFSEGRAHVSIGHRWGYIDTSGRLVIPARYGEAMPFRSGVASVRAAGSEEWILINKSGSRLGNLSFPSFLFFSDGLAAFKRGSQTGYVDTRGRTAIAPGNYWGGNFENGLAARTLQQGYAFIDKKGEIKIPGPFQEADGFSDGYARVKSGNMQGIIDTRGRYVLPARYSSVGSYSEGYFGVTINNRHGFADTSGAIVIPARHEFASAFHHGHSIVTTGGKKGLMDTSGTIVLPTRYDQVEILGRRALRVQSGGTTRYTKFDGTSFSNAQIDWMAHARDGYHLYRNPANKWGYIRERDGAVAVPARFSSGGAFADGLAPVKM